MLIKALKRKKAKFLVIGGIAATLYGFDRATYDLDLLLPKDATNLTKVLNLLHYLRFKKVFGLSKTYPPRARVLGTLRAVRPDLLIRRWAVRVKNGKTVDLIFTDSDKLYSFLWTRRREIKFRGVEIPTADLKDLIRLKQQSNRPKDQYDVEALKRLTHSR